ncbi:hypothetical protein MMG94_11750 [Methylocystis parvus OBBP]|nr:hypothetical protein [Methylocystis parvus]WBJ98694.1 hypothetical protein MMG94_11750 [Methylocystis parvus OBBP]
MMNKNDLRMTDGPPSALAEAQAEIDVVEIHRKIDLVETPGRVEFFSLDHHACRRDGGNFMRREITAPPPRRFFVETGAEMARDAAHAQKHAHMLRFPVRVEELGADCANFRVAGEIKQPFDPVRRDDLRVVIQKKKELAIAGLRARIAQRGEIEFSRYFDDFQAIKGRFNIPNQFEGPRFDAIIIDEDHIEIRIRRPLEKARQASLEKVGLVPRRDDDADRWSRVSANRFKLRRRRSGSRREFEQRQPQSADLVRR